MSLRGAISPARSVRSRLTIVGSTILLVGLALGVFSFAQLFERQLIDDLDLDLRSLATDRARTIDAGLDPETQLETEQRETAVAVFDVDGVLLANRGFVDTGELVAIAPGIPITRTLDFFEPGENEVERAELRIVAAQPGQTLVVVASELEAVGKTVNEAAGLLLLGIPLITLVGGALLWFVVGRALLPVDRMQRDAHAIADLGGDQRVHDPGTEDELGRLGSTLNDMLGRLEASATTMRRFVSDSSHEIRSPIANIRLRVETAQPGEWEEARTDVIAEVERIETIIDDLTYLARSDEGRTTVVAERVELDGLLFDEAARLQRRGNVSADASDVEPVIVTADLAQIRRAVRNLVDNAERHAGSAVRLAAIVEGSRAIIEVEDDGSGIAAEDRDRVFDRFVRLDEARDRATGGTGLGLAIVRDIIEGQGGSVVVTDGHLGGALIRIELPAA